MGPFSKGRLEALTDGIFGFAMTLLVVNFELPPPYAVESIPNLLYYIRYDFLQYVIAFMILAILWVALHQQYYYIKYIDNSMLWYGILSLMFVALMPFSTQLSDTYPANYAAASFFSANLFIIGLIFIAQWRHAASGHRLLEKDSSKEIVTDMRNRNIVIPAISLLVMILSFLGINWGILLYFTVPFIFWAVHRSHHHLHETTELAEEME